MQGGEGGVEAGYTARKFLTKQGVTNILPVTATLDRVNGVHIELDKGMRSTFHQKEMSQLLSIKTNRRGFGDYRVARNCYS